MITSHQVAEDLYIVRQHELSPQNTKPATPPPTNHIAVIDCSGSMSGDLPKIRGQLKKRLPQLLKEGDTLSLIWFSGKGDYGVLFEAEPVATLKDLGAILGAIDRWLKPIGLTGFKEPLVQAHALVERIRKVNQNPCALFFMSDGCDNQWPRHEILKVVEEAAGKLASSTFVEYGYYADRQLLSQMAAKAGGSLIFAEDFEHYEPTFEAAMQLRPSGAKRIEVAIAGDPIGGIAFTLAGSGNEIIAFEASTGKVLVPEGTEQIFYLTSQKQGCPTGRPLSSFARNVALGQQVGPDVYALDAAYAAMSLFAVRMKPEVVLPLLRATGDARLIDMFASCFGKQKYSQFMEAAKAAAYDAGRYLDGYDANRVPADDAFTVLDLVRILSTDDQTRILFDHPEFKYSRIGRGRIDANEGFYVAEQARLDEIGEALKNKKLKPADARELHSEMNAILVRKHAALKFEATPAPDGYPIANLVYNESRPNVSMLVCKPGSVDVSSRAGRPDKVPAVIPTQIWRTYTIVKDGLVNIERLPVRISNATLAQLIKAGVDISTPVVHESGLTECVIDVKPLPILNRRMVTTVSAAGLATFEFELVRQRARQKVLGHYVEQLCPTAKNASFLAQYDVSGEAWLKEQGLTSGGFSPKTVAAAASDYYMGKELNVKLKGLSTLPKVSDAAEGKSKNQCAIWMKEAIDEIEAYFKMAPKHLHEGWLLGLQKVTVNTVRALRYQTSQLKFAVIVGQTWFSEFKSLDENTLAMKINGKDVSATFELREIQIEI